MQKENLVFTGGGTAGHIMPCVALIEALSASYNIHYIGSKNGMEKKIIEQLKNVEYHSISCVKLSRGLKLGNLLIPFRLTHAIVQAKKLLKKIKPKAVFSKGGYVALPAALSAKCPLVAHESDLSIGLANKLTRRKAKYFCCAYKETAQKLKNGVYTGIPIRQSLFRPKKKTAKPTLLIIGGSLGAKSINDCVALCINELTARFNVIHITGRGKINPALKANQGYNQIEFCADMGQAYASADLVLSRGGATALFELAALKIPSLIVPLKKGSRGDQIENAQYFAKMGLCHVLDECNLTPKNLVKALDECRNDSRLTANLAKVQGVDGTKKIVELINNL